MPLLRAGDGGVLGTPAGLVQTSLNIIPRIEEKQGESMENKNIAFLVVIAIFASNTYSASKIERNNNYNYSAYLSANGYISFGDGISCKEDNSFNIALTEKTIPLALAKTSRDTLRISHIIVNIKDLTADLRNVEYYRRGVYLGEIDHDENLIVSDDSYIYACAQKLQSIKKRNETDRNIVENETSIAKTKSFKDPRDGQYYKWIEIGGKSWMAQNLNYKPKYGETWCYDNDIKKCKAYGRLYDWKSAQSACPIGWHLPSIEEWDAMIDSVGDSSAAGDILKSKNNWEVQPNGSSGNGSDAHGFAALPAGWRVQNGSFFLLGRVGIYWSSTLREPKYPSDKSAYEIEFYSTHGDVYRSNSGEPIDMGLSIRCLKD